uniref:Uncharacterized protein n=1 Tax=Sphaerodactylus townsendi TaxID=933632 RepID=A0ACB8ER96_9SAUR
MSRMFTDETEGVQWKKMNEIRMEKMYCGPFFKTSLLNVGILSQKLVPRAPKEPFSLLFVLKHKLRNLYNCIKPFYTPKGLRITLLCLTWLISMLQFSTGPKDARFVWKKNGQTIAGVKEQFHALADGRMHLLSWVTDAIAQDSEYCCLVVSKAGSGISKVVISVEGNSVML